VAAFALLRASHLPPTVAVTAIATALAVSVGRGAGAALVAVAVCSGQLSVGWSNDYIDRHRDRDAARLDKPIVTGQVNAHTVRRAALLAGFACVPLSLSSGWLAGGLHLVAVGFAMAYNLGLKATILSPLPFVVAFGILPAFVTLGLPGEPWPPVWAIAAAGILGCGAHFVNTLGDTADDLAHGVAGLPQRIGAERSLRVGASLLATAVVVLTFAPPGRPTVLAAVFSIASLISVAGVAVSAVLGATRTAWMLTIATAIGAVALLMANGNALA
jgi:4-hydroxybenzoate polyprenyltransferase